MFEASVSSTIWKSSAKPTSDGLLAHDVMRQAVEGAHAVTDVWQQAACSHKAGHAGGEVIDCRIDQGHDQHFLVLGHAAERDKLGRQVGQHLGLAAARHGRDTHLAAHIDVNIVENGLLLGTGLKTHGRSGARRSTCWMARNSGPCCSLPSWLSSESAR